MTITHEAFFGDREREFRLTFTLVEELQRLTGVGIGGLFDRLVRTRQFYRADMIETIRLGLIGGGGTPKDAATLVKVYADEVPFMQIYPLAVDIMSATWFGVDVKSQFADLESSQSE